MKLLFVLFACIFFGSAQAQDSAINKMNRTNDRNRVTDTVNAGGTNDQMNVYNNATKDSIKQSDSLNNLRTDSVPTTQIVPTPAKERVWVSRGAWLGLIVVIIALVARRRKRSRTK